MPCPKSTSHRPRCTCVRRCKHSLFRASTSTFSALLEPDISRNRLASGVCFSDPGTESGHDVPPIHGPRSGKTPGFCLGGAQSKALEHHEFGSLLSQDTPPSRGQSHSVLIFAIWAQRVRDIPLDQTGLHIKLTRDLKLQSCNPLHKLNSQNFVLESCFSSGKFWYFFASWLGRVAKGQGLGCPSPIKRNYKTKVLHFQNDFQKNLSMDYGNEFREYFWHVRGPMVLKNGYTVRRVLMLIEVMKQPPACKCIAR